VVKSDLSVILTWDQRHEEKELGVHLIRDVLKVEFLFVRWEVVNRISRNSYDMIM